MLKSLTPAAQHLYKAEVQSKADKLESIQLLAAHRNVVYKCFKLVTKPNTSQK